MSNITFFDGDSIRYHKTGSSFIDCPQEVNGKFLAMHCGLTSLVGGPKKVGACYQCDWNNLKSLEGVAAEIGDYLSVDDSSITTLCEIHRQIKRIGTLFFCRTNPIETGGLGLLLVPGLISIIGSLPPLKIIDKFLGRPKEIFRCQKELIDAGYEEYAKL